MLHVSFKIKTKQEDCIKMGEVSSLL